MFFLCVFVISHAALLSCCSKASGPALRGEHRCSGSVGWVNWGSRGCSREAEEETLPNQSLPHTHTHIQSCCCALPSIRVRHWQKAGCGTVLCEGKHSGQNLICVFPEQFACLGGRCRELDRLAAKGSAVAYRLWCWSWVLQWLAREQGVLSAAGMLLLPCWVSRSIQGVSVCACVCVCVGVWCSSSSINGYDL